MINKLLGLFLSFMLSLHALAQFADDFTDGDFVTNPTWFGNDALFTVTSGELQSNNPSAGTYYLATSSTLAANAEWIFDVNLKFSTSGANYVDVFLMSDNNDLTLTQNGYFVRIGSTQDDVKLYNIVGGTETALIDAIDGIVNSSSNNPFRIRVMRDASNMWTLEYDDGILGSYNTAGTITDNSINSSISFGVRITQSSAAGPINNHFFDNFYSGVIGADTQAPQIDSLQVVDANNLKVYFNEMVDLNTSQNVANYSADNGLGTPDLAVRNATDSSVVDLNFAAGFVNGQTYQLSVQNVTDNSGNAMSPDQLPFAYVVIIPANYGDIVINEIFPDPNPSVGLPTAEFVELYNTTSSPIDLNGWKFVNTTTEKTLTNFVLNANDYVILCNQSDTGLFQPYGSVIGISSFSALTNGGDSLTLVDQSANIIDIVNYDISWYQDDTKDDGGYSLELINPVHACGSSSSNWTASASSNGGTPGSQNAVFDTTPDTEAPQIDQITIVSSSQITLFFNELMDSLSLENGNYSLTNGITVASVVVGEDLLSVTLNLASNIDSSLVYDVTASNVADCSGNSGSSSIAFGIGVQPALFDVIITELFPDPSPTVGLPEEEYIEVYNRTTKVIDLSGAWIADLSSANQIATGKLFPGEYAIICDDNNTNAFSSFGKVITVSSLPSLNNTNENYQLFNADSVLIHNVHYFDEWYQDENKSEGGWSLEMIDYDNPCGGIENWSASNKWFGGTPGTENSVYTANPDVTSPSLVTANALNDTTVLITFSEQTFLGSIDINNGIVISSIESLNDNGFQLNLSTALTAQTVYEITVSGAYDCVNNGIDGNALEFALPEPANPGDIVINEVLFNPLPGSSDFVEIYNNSDKFISLQNWNLANLDNDSIDNYKTIANNPYLLKPKSFALLSVNVAQVKNDYIEAKENAFLQIESMPTYSNDEGSVYLLNDSNEIIDYFNYNEDMHFALLSSLDGVSLERIDYDRSTNDPTNWHSAAESVGYATPGYENSQFLEAEINDVITITPETFSPDNDGYDDVVNISYQTGQPGMVANVIIYDTRGRLVRNLVRNEYIADSGTFSWDGINEKNEKAAIGIYIVYVEIFDASGNVNKYKKTCVLAGQLN